MGKKKLRVIKIGGNIIDDPAALTDFLRDFATLGGLNVLVHGGGKLASELSRKLHIEPQLIDGRRVTDAETLRIVTMVYAGYINKNIVAQLQAHGRNALGICGADANAIRAHKRTHPSIDYGFVGDIDTVSLEPLLTACGTLVIAPITHDGQGQLLNTNADTIARATGVSLSDNYEVELYYCFEKRGLLANVDDGASVISRVTVQLAKELIEKQVISGGMLPKVQNILEALDAGVEKVILCHAQDLSAIIAGKTIFGTTFTRDEN